MAGVFLLALGMGGCDKRATVCFEDCGDGGFVGQVNPFAGERIHVWSSG